jgi:hypothetical protein
VTLRHIIVQKDGQAAVLLEQLVLDDFPIFQWNFQA